MSQKEYVLIGVEGSHDQAFVGKVFKLLGFQDFKKVHKGNIDKLDPFRRKLIPEYPNKKGDLYARLYMPSIFFTETISVAIFLGEGSNLISNLDDIISNNSSYQENLTAFAIIVDSDKKDPQSIAQEFSTTFKEYYPNFSDKPGVISKTSPRTGIYILPDNQNQGVLETILLECGNQVYSEYLEQANHYINSLDNCSKKFHRWKAFDQEKAIIASVVSVLKPGKTNTVSIADNNWISQETQNVAILANFISFIKQLLGEE